MPIRFTAAKTDFEKTASITSFPGNNYIWLFCSCKDKFEKTAGFKEFEFSSPGNNHILFFAILKVHSQHPAKTNLKTHSGW